jgi:transposase
MPVLVQRCCGLDVHQATVVACVRVPGKGRRQRTGEVRPFETTTAALLPLAAWLTEQGVTPVAMESTGVDWRPVFKVLEGSFEGILVKAPHDKTVPGRKTDGKDAEWLAQLLAPGLLRASFIPPRPIREVGALTRSRKTLVQSRASEINRLHNLVESANIKLGLVATDIMGASGRAMRRALGAGERDGGALADLAKGGLRHQRSRVVEALPGRFTEPHASLWGEVLAHLASLEGAIARLGARLAGALEP